MSFEVEIARCRSFLGHKFVKGSGNPLTETMVELLENPALTYAESTLARIHESFRPLSMGDLVAATDSQDLQQLDQLPVDRRLYRYPWQVTSQAMEEVVKNPRHDPNYYFGPHKATQSDFEFQRAKGVLDSIRHNGYQPEISWIDGYFLGDASNFCFVVGSGNHRVAALAALGATTMKVRLHAHPAVIHGEHLANFTKSRGGPWTTSSSRAIYTMYLNGQESDLHP